MWQVPVYNTEGKKIDAIEVDASFFGEAVNTSLLKQAVVAYHANRRQGSARTRSRGEISGSTRKLFRQKGTGNARRGALRTHKVRGGGVAFAKRVRNYSKVLPRKMRRAALDSAILAKIIGEDLMVVDGLAMAAPKTAQMATVLANLKVNRSCLLALAARDSNLYLSSRNIGDLTVRIAAELNASDVATRQKMLVTADAMKLLMGEKAES